MVTRFGMGRDPDASDAGLSGRGVLSLFVPRNGSNLPSEVQPAATRAIRAILDKAYADACDTLAEHLITLRRIAAYLVQEERLDGETFAALFDGTIEVPAADGEWRPAGTRPRDWADVVPFRDRRLRGSDAAAVAASLPAADLELAPELAPALDAAPEPLTDPIPISAALADDMSAAIAADPEPADGAFAPVLARLPDGPTMDLRSAPVLASSGTPALPQPPVRRIGAGRRVRSLASGWLQAASLRIAPKDRAVR
jgi:hypothetical protein